MPLLLVAAAALIDAENRVLIQQRPQGKPLAGLWEFPGGKVNACESPEAALIRELREELGLGVESCDLEPLTFASCAYPDFHLLMPLYLCRNWTGPVRALEGQAFAFACPCELARYPMPPADLPLIGPLAAALRR
jgi:8-oxo-dGTP diphosphatase